MSLVAWDIISPLSGYFKLAEFNGHTRGWCVELRIKVIFLPKLQSLEAQNNISFLMFSWSSTEKGEEGF